MIRSILTPLVYTICIFFGQFCSAEYFYIYEWPDYLADVYPPPGSTLDAAAAYSHDFYDNGGAGKMIDGDFGMFSTWQFSLFKNLMSRLRVSEFRTRDPSRASAFIIPYDAGVHSFIDHNTGKPRLASPHGWRAIDLLTQAKRQHPEVYWKSNGHDHFVIFSVTCYQKVGIGTKEFFMGICENCTVLTIESTPAGYPIPGRNKKLWHALPYPSSYHYWEGQVSAPWTLRPRHILSIFIGSVKTQTAASNALRRALYAQCQSVAGNVCQWFETTHADTEVITQSQALTLYRHTQYCLSPPGDSLTRKSIFDSYLSGCVPVIFAKGTLLQYNWHLPHADLLATTVYIPKNDILGGKVNFLDVLRAIKPEQLLAMQQRIKEIAFRLQYSVVPTRYQEWSSSNKGGNVSSGGWDGGAVVWRPPREDAVDIVIDHILSRSSIEPVEGFAEDELRARQEEQKHIMTKSEDYMGTSGAVAVGEVGTERGRAIGRGSELWGGAGGGEGGGEQQDGPLLSAGGGDGGEHLQLSRKWHLGRDNEGRASGTTGKGRGKGWGVGAGARMKRNHDDGGVGSGKMGKKRARGRGQGL